MKVLGFDEIEHLEAVSNNFQDTDCSTTGSAGEGGSKLSRIILKVEQTQGNIEVERVAHGGIDDEHIVDGKILDYLEVWDDSLVVKDAPKALAKPRIQVKKGCRNQVSRN